MLAVDEQVDGCIPRGSWSTTNHSCEITSVKVFFPVGVGDGLLEGGCFLGGILKAVKLPRGTECAGLGDLLALLCLFFGVYRAHVFRSLADGLEPSNKLAVHGHVDCFCTDTGSRGGRKGRKMIAA